jgi:hypothetical protein
MRTTLRRVYLPGTAVTAHSCSNLLAGSKSITAITTQKQPLFWKRAMKLIPREGPSSKQALPFSSPPCFARGGNSSRHECTCDSG